MDQCASSLRNHLKVGQSVAIHLMLLNIEHFGEEDVWKSHLDELGSLEGNVHILSGHG